VIVRRAIAADLPAILKMSAQFVPSLGIGVEYDEVSASQTFANLLSQETSVLLVAEGDEVCGMLGGLIYPHFFNTSRLIAQELFWWVDPEARGTRAGLLLWQGFEDWARGQGAHNVSMIAIAQMDCERIGRMYEKRGYRPMESSYVRTL
jgi:hypothetical protein